MLLDINVFFLIQNWLLQMLLTISLTHIYGCLQWRKTMSGATRNSLFDQKGYQIPLNAIRNISITQ